MISLIAKWFIVGMFTVGAFIVINAIGKPRQPLTTRAASIVVAWNAFYVTAIVLWWHT